MKGEIEKLETGMAGFDVISGGGLPKNRTTLVAGTAGSAKTVFGCQFLAQGVKKFNQPGVFVTFEEQAKDIIRNTRSFGWEIDQWIKDGLWAFVDSSPDEEAEVIMIGEFDLQALLARISEAVERVGADRVVLDSIGAIFSQFREPSLVRRELLRLTWALKAMGVTTLTTAERTEEYGDIARYGVEEFVADNVVILRNVLEDESRRRTLEILKYRGTDHGKGEFPISIMADKGIVLMPLSSIELQHSSSEKRVTSGNDKLDEMCGGGFFRDSIILVSGATGTGKTLTVTGFINGGFKAGEKVLLFAFEESREQLLRNASAWGVDIEKIEREGRFKVVCVYPEFRSLEDHLVLMQHEIDTFKPSRVAVDSLSALERVSTRKSFREFVLGMTSFLKQGAITGMFTATTPTLMGGPSITEAHISTITDSIILLRYVEMLGEMRRGVTVLKMRGSMHDKQIREITIDSEGMHIGNAFKQFTGIIGGVPRQISSSDEERLREMF